MKHRAWYLLLVFPFIGLLWPALYNRASPALLGLPFFYWYQLAWVILTSLILGAVYLLCREHPDV
ncbi:MAG: DUF3311 domain-containing protein [Vulcanimicrobiaceae bacterium]